MKTRVLSIAFILLTFGQILSALGFSTFGPGFYAKISGSVFRCSELLSSGGDDQVVMLIFMALIIPVVFRAIRLDYPAGTIEAFVYFGILATCWFVSIFRTDCGEFGTTIWAIHDPYLLANTAFTIISALIMVRLAFRN